MRRRCRANNLLGEVLRTVVLVPRNLIRVVVGRDEIEVTIAIEIGYVCALRFLGISVHHVQ
ncbi:MAG: hypothetical protein R2854_27625 [Caldilineaceae bacterium]